MVSGETGDEMTTHYEVFIDEGPVAARPADRFTTQSEAEQYAAAATDGKWVVYEVNGDNQRVVSRGKGQE
jgi:hypothetical protein